MTERMRWIGTKLVLAGAVVTALAAAPALGAEIRVLSANALSAAEKDFAAEFTKESGHTVAFTFGSPGTIDQRLAAGEAYDLIITAAATFDPLEKAGKLRKDSRRPLVRVGIGIAAREGAKLDVSTPDALRQTLLAARSITYSDSSTGGLSGINAQKVLDNLGVAEAVKGKAILKSSGQDLIASGEAEIGLFNVSEIPRAKGVVLAGKVPAAVQAYINYDAAVPAAQASPEHALAFLQYMARPVARARWEAAGLELVND
jgi:molybdate transport system substrate-binding protein